MVFTYILLSVTDDSYLAITVYFCSAFSDLYRPPTNPVSVITPPLYADSINLSSDGCSVQGSTRKECVQENEKYHNRPIAR